jgi:ComF family protein
MHLFDLLFPKFCLGCGKWGTYICSTCAIKLHPLSYLKCPECERPAIDGKTHPRCLHTYGLDGIVSFFSYTSVIKQAIKTMKYRFAYAVCEDVLTIISQGQIERIRKLLNITNQTVFIPIPLHPNRLRWRGFNQAEIITRLLVKRIGGVVKNDVLVRIKETVPQVDMKNREARLVNMHHVFKVKKDVDMIKTVVLVDDVFTTGATLRSAAAALKHAGVKFVWGMTIAQ